MGSASGRRKDAKEAGSKGHRSSRRGSRSGRRGSAKSAKKESVKKKAGKKEKKEKKVEESGVEEQVEEAPVVEKLDGSAGESSSHNAISIDPPAPSSPSKGTKSKKGSKKKAGKKKEGKKSGKNKNSKGSGKKKGSRRSSRRSRRKTDDDDYITENIYSQADGIILDKIQSKDNRAVKDLVSDEIYNPAGSDVVEYGDAKVWDFSEVHDEFSIDSIKTVEEDPYEKATVVDLEKVTRVIDFDGKELVETEESKKKNKGKKGPRRDLPRRKKIDESKLEYNPLDALQDYKSNWDSYKIKCKTCHNSKRCQVCNGTGRRFIILKCKNCGGTGICPDCKKAYGVKCKECGDDVIAYSPRCQSCGHEYRCPKCHSLLPVGATKCLSCGENFQCRRCKLVVAPGSDRKCPRCEARVKQPLY